MPVKKRRPKGRNFVISPVAIDAFRKMEAARAACTCPPIDWDQKPPHYPDRCAACDEWWKAHWTLHQELDLFPHQWPAFEYPDAESPYPEGCFADRHWHAERAARPEAFELYEMLKAAAKGKAA